MHAKCLIYVTFDVYLRMLTENKILQAAIEVLNDDFSAPLDVIADKAAVNRRTLHRYFKDRNQLIQQCRHEMMRTCKAAMNEAFNSQQLPLKQLEYMLYAGIDCNYKYAFLNKLQQREQPKLINDLDSDEFDDNVKIKWHNLIISLQKEGIISDVLTPHWIFYLFDGMINTTITAMQSGYVAPNDIKRFAWYSFAKSIGIKLKHSSAKES
jgi:AcrR family transcriptional regulator